MINHDDIESDDDSDDGHDGDGDCNCDGGGDDADDGDDVVSVYTGNSLQLRICAHMLLGKHRQSHNLINDQNLNKHKQCRKFDYFSQFFVNTIKVLYIPPNPDTIHTQSIHLYNHGATSISALW